MTWDCPGYCHHEELCCGDNHPVVTVELGKTKRDGVVAVVVDVAVETIMETVWWQHHPPERSAKKRGCTLGPF